MIEVRKNVILHVTIMKGDWDLERRSNSDKLSTSSKRNLNNYQLFLHICLNLKSVFHTVCVISCNLHIFRSTMPFTHMGWISPASAGNTVFSVNGVGN